MRIKNLFPEAESFKKTILRAYKSEPLIRYVLMRNDGIIMVRSAKSIQELKQGKDYDNWIGWPKSDVYLYDPRIFEMLSRLYQEGKSKELEEAWSNIERVCND